MGLGFNAASNIQEALSQALGQEAAIAMGNTPMPALFAQDANISHFFDVQLGRSAPGVFIIGSHTTNFQNVSNAPQLPSVAPNHWSPVLDAMIVNGKAFAFNASRIANVPAGKVVAALDTGTSLPPLPALAVDAIYSSIPGAEFDDVSSNWFVPCNGSTTLSFVFGNEEFFVHPLDLTFPMVTAVDGTNRTACVNTYQYSTIDFGDNTGFDLILGDAFLRNVYVSFNYGDAQNSSAQPFVQMVSTTTDMAAALQEFQTQRAATLAQLP
ncbi:acid protease, partial [Trametes versicolor FP-101664 SS1]|uniref:acid protease n=1 Tax=Trametes versicolor (strain FP-101664) TaxID=717944 RepID=UPI00046233BE